MEKVEEAQLSPQMEGLIAENLTEIFKRLDKQTFISPDGTKYLSRDASLKLTGKSKSYLYDNICKAVDVRRYYHKNAAYFNEGDLLEGLKKLNDSQPAIERLKSAEDELVNYKENNAIGMVQSLLKEKENDKTKLESLNKELRDVDTKRAEWEICAKIFGVILVFLVWLVFSPRH